MRKSKWLIWSIIISMLLTMNFSTMVLASSSPTTLTYPDYPNLELSLIARYDTGAVAGAEIVSYDPKSKKAFLVNGAEKSLDILDLSQLRGSKNDVTQLNNIKRISISNLGESFNKVSDITSVAVDPNGKFIAVAVPAEPKTDNGKVIFFDLEGKLLKALEVGALPDMVTFTPDGKKVLVANEGEPSDDYAVDPEGTVSIIDVSAGASQASVATVRFTDEGVVDKNVRIAKPGAAQAQDFEPEYIAVEADSKTAFVSLQENNAIAKLDIENKKFTRVYGLGYKDHSVIGKGMDASDKDGKINIKPWPVQGMYQPDGITLLNVNGNSYLLTANEGDSRDYAGYSEEGTIGKIKGDIALKAEHYSGYSQKQLDEMVAKGLFDDKQLGRLSITTANGKNANGKYEALYSYGGRSFSIWNTKDFTQVFDSGEDLERITAKALPDQFNSNSEKNGMDNRSDNKGPEPEGVAIGKIGDQDYAFVALERIGGIMVYNVSKPEKPVFVGYYSSRDFSKEVIAGDSAPEGLKFVSAENSPTGKPLLLAANEFSGTVAVYEINVSTKKTITILHTNDTHSRVVEGQYDGMGFAKLTTMFKQYKAQNPNTLILDAGDTFHGQTIATLLKGESIAKLMNIMGYDAMTAGNHDFNYGYQRLLELDGMTNFPILSANVKQADGKRLLTPYIIKEVEGIKIGIFGLSTPETTYKTHPKNVEGLTFVDPVEEAKVMVAELKGKVDVIVALAHLGMDKSSQDTSTKLAQAVPEIDLIVDGHSHTTLKDGMMVGNTLIASAGEYDKNLGAVQLTFEGNKLIAKKAGLVTKVDTEWIAEDKDVLNIINGIKNEQEKVLSQVIGKTAVKLDGEREQVRKGETNLGNLIADAMISVSGADAAITNGGGIRASIEAGDITKGQIITVLPFGNYIVTKKVKGADIKAALELGVKPYPELNGAFPHVSGITYTIDPSKPAGEKVTSILIKGKPLDMNQDYVLATNDFMAAGGDGYTMFADDAIANEYPALDEAVISYIQARQVVEPQVEGRIVEKPANAIYIVKAGDLLWKIAKQYNTTWEKLQEINKLKNPNLIFPGQEIIVPAQ